MLILIRLDSRQRKKQHTERLEEEKKHYTSLITELEETLNETKAQEAAWQREKDNWAMSQQQYQRYIESMAMEKEEIVRRHTIETGELRKKNALLMEKMQRMEGTAMSTAPSSTGFSADFSDFDHLTMNSWDEFSVAHDFSIEADQRVDAPLVAMSKKDMAPDISNNVSGDDKAVSSGFLLMLLLCGAWVASRSPSDSTNLLPTIPDDLRTASATVLDNIYRDSGVQIQDPTTGPSGFATTMHDASHGPKTTLSAFEFASISQSPLEDLHHRLVAPSEQQLREQAFSLTADQYNDLTSTGGFAHSSSRDTRRSIGEILAASRIPSEGVAETYTQSLMKDRVSSQVLKDFARMVVQSKHGPQGQWKSEPVD